MLGGANTKKGNQNQRYYVRILAEMDHFPSVAANDSCRLCIKKCLWKNMLNVLNVGERKITSDWQIDVYWSDLRNGYHVEVQIYRYHVAVLLVAGILLHRVWLGLGIRTCFFPFLSIFYYFFFYKFKLCFRSTALSYWILQLINLTWAINITAIKCLITLAFTRKLPRLLNFLSELFSFSTSVTFLPQNVFLLKHKTNSC